MIELKLYKKLHSAGGEMELEVDIKIEAGEFVALSGPSGSGKTTLLRLIAGLAEADGGQIKLHDEYWLDTTTGINLPPQKRNVGLVFQDYALFPNMTVRKNLEYALGKKGPSQIIDELAQMMELDELMDRYPSRLSGGQQQRVALARSLVRRPPILLLDEPLSALDAAMRSRLQDYILEMHRRFSLTTLLVSHDFVEIFKMADRVIQLDEGKIIKEGRPKDVFFSRTIGGKFKFAGKVLSITANDVVFIVKVLVGMDVVEVIVSESEVEGLMPGDEVVLISKAFNPILVR